MYLGSIIALAFLSLASPTSAQEDHDEVNTQQEQFFPPSSLQGSTIQTTTRTSPTKTELRKMREKALLEEGVLDITKATDDPLGSDLSRHLLRKDAEKEETLEGPTHSLPSGTSDHIAKSIERFLKLAEEEEEEGRSENGVKTMKEDARTNLEMETMTKDTKASDEIVKRVKQLISSGDKRIRDSTIDTETLEEAKNTFEEPVSKNLNTYKKIIGNISSILVHPVEGTTVVYRETTFKPIITEELRRNVGLTNARENVSYLPLAKWQEMKPIGYESSGNENEIKEGRTTIESVEPREEDVLEAADFGMQAMNDLYYIKEPKLFSMGLFLGDDTPGHYVAAFNAQTEEAKQLAKFGYAALEGARLFANKYPGISRQASFVGDTRMTALHRQCPRRGIPPCPPASLRYRTADGSCNNPQELWWGSAMSTMNRLLPAVYHDGIQSIRRSGNGRLLPSPRQISNIIHQDRDVPLASVTHMLMQWGQFVDHDITATGQSRAFNGTVPQCCLNGGAGFQPPEFMHPECLPIAVSTSDSFFSHIGLRCLEFVRSGPAPREDCSFGPREQLSQVTSYLDASPVYSSSAPTSDSLRLFRNGLLQYGRIQSRKPLLPRQETDLCRRGSLSTGCFRAGDGRLSEQPALTSLHVVFLRQHNKIATQLAALNPHWSDEKLYQETRRIIGAFVQHITYREFLPIVLGQEVMRLFDLDVLRKGYYEGYDSTVNPNIVNSFSTAAYRFGHSLVQHSFVRYERDHRPIFNNVTIHEEFSNPVNLETAGSMDRLLLGLVNQPSQKRDEFITEELTNHLFQTPNSPFGMDLASLNIQRGRDHGLPPYIDWREPCSLSPIKSWEDLDRIMPPATARKFRLLYSSIEDIDLFPAGLAENPVVGGLVGPTFACIIAQQFSNLRKGDRFWYENPNRESSFTPAQLQQIRRVTFAQILCRTTDSVDTIQPFVFLTPDTFRNERLSCTDDIIGSFNLNAWAERLPEQRNNSKQKSKTQPRRKTCNRNKNPNTKLKSEKNSTTPVESQRRDHGVQEKNDPENQKSFFDFLKPVKASINQHNKILVRRPFGSHENLTIVVQNNAVNSPVFINDPVTSSNFQFTHTSSNDQTGPRPTTTGYTSHNPQRPSPKPIPTARPYGNDHHNAGFYVPQSFEDPSNPNPPSYGFASNPVNNYFPTNVFFDRLPTTPKPTLYTYYTSFKPTPTRKPTPSFHYNSPHPDYELDNPNSYGVSRPSTTRPQIIPENPQTFWTPRPTYEQSWSPESNYNQNWASSRPGQSDANGWTDIPTYSANKPPSQRPTINRPDPSRPQYWPEHSTTTKKDPATSYYYSSEYQISNAQANINPRPLKAQSVTIVTETDEDVHYSDKRIRPQNKKDVPKPFLAQHKDFDDAQHKGEGIELKEGTTEKRRPGQYYYDKNVLHRYPDRNGTNAGNNSANGNEDLSFHGENWKIGEKYQIERLTEDRGDSFVVNSKTKAQVVQEEIRLTTTATIVLDDTNDDTDDGYNDTNDDQDDADEEDELEGAYSEDTESIVLPDNVPRPIEWLEKKENCSLTLNADMPQIYSDGLTSAKELPKPFKQRGRAS